MTEKNNFPIIAYFDGACEPFNPGGVATWGVVIFKGDQIDHKDCGIACAPYTPQATNNYAEYTALIKALEFCLEKNFLSLVVKGDSQLVIRQINGQYAVRSSNIMPLYKQAEALIKNFASIKFYWVPRGKNFLADEMSKKAYQDYLNSHKEEILMPFGKHKGRPLFEVAKTDRQYLQWLIKQQNIRQELIECISLYLEQK